MLIKGESAWRPRFLLADTPGFPDTNPALFLDAQERVWLLWGTIVANEWHKSDDPQIVASRALVREHAADKYFSRMGWMTRAHPITLPSGRIIIPLYSDGYSFSIMALSDDAGVTWSASTPRSIWSGCKGRSRPSHRERNPAYIRSVTTCLPRARSSAAAKTRRKSTPARWRL